MFTVDVKQQYNNNNFHRKINQSEKVSCTKFWFHWPRSSSYSSVTGQTLFWQLLKKNLLNFTQRCRMMRKYVLLKIPCSRSQLHSEYQLQIYVCVIIWKLLKQIMKKHVPCMTLDTVPWVKVITSSQLQGVRGLLEHLLYTVTFLVITCFMIVGNIICNCVYGSAADKKG